MCCKVFITSRELDDNGEIASVSINDVRGVDYNDHGLDLKTLGTIPCTKDTLKSQADKLVEDFADSTTYTGDIHALYTVNGDIVYMFTSPQMFGARLLP